MGNLRKKSAFFKLNLQCFSAYFDLRNVWYCAFVVARYKTKKFQNWKKYIYNNNFVFNESSHR